MRKPNNGAKSIGSLLLLELIVRMQQKLTLIVESQHSFLPIIGQHGPCADIAGFRDVYL
jgi:hypothetical protein